MTCKGEDVRLRDLVKDITTQLGIQIIPEIVLEETKYTVQTHRRKHTENKQQEAATTPQTKTYDIGAERTHT